MLSRWPLPPCLRVRYWLLLAALWLPLLAACGSSGSSSSGSSSGSSMGSCTGSLAWCAPVGKLVQGATLSDGWKDLRYVPAPVNVSGGWTDSVAVTPDGRHLYFGYSRYDFALFNISVRDTPSSLVFDVTGPARLGVTADVFKIFRADLAGAGWTLAYPDVNDPDPAVSEASASVNEAQDLMVYSEFAANGDATLYAATLSGGSWSSLGALSSYGDPSGIYINDAANCPGESGDDNGFIIGNYSSQVTLYWESHRGSVDGTTCGGKRHIYQSTFTNATGTWSTIQIVPGLADLADPNFGESDDSQVSFSPDGATAYWTSIRTYSGTPTYGIFTADWDGSAYTNVRLIVNHTTSPPNTGNLLAQGELNVAEVPEGWIGYFMCGVAQSEDDHDLVLSVCRMRKPK